MSTETVLLLKRNDHEVANIEGNIPMSWFDEDGMYIYIPIKMIGSGNIINVTTL